MKYIIITLLLLIAVVTTNAQTAIPVGHSAKIKYTYNGFQNEVINRFWVDPTSKAKYHYRLNATGNGFELFQNWIDVGSDLYYSAGRVAIGTATFSGALNFANTSNIGTGIGTSNFRMGSSSLGALTSGNYNFLFGISNFNAATTLNQSVGIGNGNFTSSTTCQGCVGLGESNLTHIEGTGVVGIGSSNFPNATTGTYLYGIGQQNGNAATTANQTVAIGFQNFLNNAQINDCVSIGWQPFLFTTGNMTGVSNIGVSNGRGMNTATQVAMFGNSVFNSVTDTDVSYAIGIGSGAGNGAGRADSTIFIGRNAGQNNTRWGAIAIGNGATNDADHQIRLGNSGTRQLWVGNYRFNTDQSSITNGHVLTYNATTGEAEFQSPGAGGGTVTGTGSAGQVSYWSGTSTQAGSNNFFWDATNSRLGIGTTTPSYVLDVLTATPKRFRAGGGNTSQENIILDNNGWGDVGFFNYAQSSPSFRRGLSIRAASTYTSGYNGDILTTDIQNGWVGVRTYPDYLLHITGGDDNQGIALGRGANLSRWRMNSTGDVILSTTTGNYSFAPEGASIGNYDPATPLHLFAVGGVGANDIFTLEKSGFGKTIFQQYYTTFDAYGLRLLAGDGTTVLSTNNFRKRIGINLTDPTVELDISGEIKATSLTSAGNRLVQANSTGVLNDTAIDPANVFLNNGNSFAVAATIGTNDANTMSIETNGTTRTTYTSAGTITNTLANNQNFIIDASGNAATSNTLLVGKGPVNSTQSTIYLSGQDAAGAPQVAIAADNSSIQLGATANKPLQIFTNGTYRARWNADGRMVIGGSAATSAATNTQATIVTPATSGYVALSLAPYENGADQSTYMTFNTPGGIERGKVHLNADLYFESAGNLYLKSNGASNNTIMQANGRDFQANGAGWFKLPALTADPASPSPGAIFNRSDLGRLFIVDETATINTFMTLEKDIQGSAISVGASTHTPGGYNLYTTYNANSNAITATLGASMYDGRTYILRATNNGTNAVTLNADTANGVTFALDGTSGSATTYTMATAEILRATRYGTTIILDK